MAWQDKQTLEEDELVNMICNADRLIFAASTFFETELKLIIIIIFIIIIM